MHSTGVTAVRNDKTNSSRTKTATAILSPTTTAVQSPSKNGNKVDTPSQHPIHTTPLTNSTAYLLRRRKVLRNQYTPNQSQSFRKQLNQLQKGQQTLEKILRDNIQLQNKQLRYHHDLIQVQIQTLLAENTQLRIQIKDITGRYQTAADNLKTTTRELTVFKSQLKNKTPNPEGKKQEEAATSLQHKDSTSSQLQEQLQQKVPRSTLVILPTAPTQNIAQIKQTIEDTKKPASVQITKFKTSANKIEIRCRTEEQKDTLKRHLHQQQTVTTLARIEDKNPTKAKVIFPNLPETIGTEDILQQLKQDHDITEEQIYQVIRQANHRNPSINNLLLELNKTQAKQLITSKQIFIGLKAITCERYVRLYRCKNCQAFEDHSTENCRNRPVCNFCAGKHNSEDCTAERPRCINCTNWNRHCESTGEQHEKIQYTDHPANYSHCPYYLHERKTRAYQI